MTNKIIEIRDLNFSFGDRKIFTKLSLDVNDGSFTTIIGPTGSGKSLLAKIIIGQINSKSFVKIDGQFINFKNIKEIRKKIGYIPENIDNLLVYDTVIENLKFYLGKNNIKNDNIDNKINEISTKLDLNSILNRNIDSLSGGEKQLTVLACILLQNSKILIMDEALTIIDPLHRKKIFKYLKQLNKNGMTIINFTQDSETLLEGTDIVIINNGDVLLNEKTNKAFQNSKLFIDNKIALPFIVDLSIKLQYYQTIEDIFFDSKKLVNYLWK